ncbi:MAG TPA: HAD family hydrolase [Clostridiales bacterium]|nr:HAD family hydrolase [Clostridiales bacterium]
MKIPKLALFDFGGTLADDGELDIDSGLKAVLNAAGVKEYDEDLLRNLWIDMQEQVLSDIRTPKGYRVETPLSAIFRNIFARAGIKVDLPLTECEYIFDKFNSTRKRTPYIDELLNVMREKGIRTGVISNIVMSGESLKMAIDELLPDNKFEFILTSCDYLFQKPAPHMFEAAAKITGVEPQDCWYLGDSYRADVLGASPVGMTAFRYKKEQEEEFLTLTAEIDGKEYTYYGINSWKVLANMLREN